jgi:transaldolase
LLEEDPPVVSMIDTPAPQSFVDELLERIPDFQRAYLEEGLSVDEFQDFGPVVLFRHSFVDGWRYLLKTIRERRKETSHSGCRKTSCDRGARRPCGEAS